MTPLGKTIYIGAFVHCKSLDELEVWPEGAIGVDEDGKIAFIMRDEESGQSPANQGWERAKVVQLKDHGFFFPGFIGL